MLTWKTAPFMTLVVARKHAFHQGDRYAERAIPWAEGLSWRSSRVDHARQTGPPDLAQRVQPASRARSTATWP